MYGNTTEGKEYRESVTRKAIQEEIGSCREWLEDDSMSGRCNEPADYVLWGKLIDPEGLGPRCYDHAAKHVGERALHDPSWAIISVTRLCREIDKAHWPHLQPKEN